MAKRTSVVFFHPDLGIGGAERLVIDAAVGLQELGHKVTIFTSHRDISHCFDEARDGTLDVRVRGDLLFPATLFGRFKILFTILRHYHLLFTIVINGELAALQSTVFFVDQLSTGIPFLRYKFTDTRILFYCHFPDLLLVQQRQRWMMRLWRLPFDWLEGWSMKGADRVVVNSEFTKGVVKSVWHGLGGNQGVGVVYPCVNTGKQTHETEEIDAAETVQRKPLCTKVILSINRFERKKDVGLAIKAFAGLKAADRKGCRLVVAGGYDSRVNENVSYHSELVNQAESLGFRTASYKNIITALSVPANVEVLFLLSVSTQLKSMLLRNAKLLVYTPSNEHFGIVPLEAMLAEVPVLAVNSGGPLETVVEGKTGWLRSTENIAGWTEVMREVLSMSDSRLKYMGVAGREWVEANFSETNMAQALDQELQRMCKAPRTAVTELQDVLLAIGLLGVLLVVAGSLLGRFVLG
ncbi:Alpha-1,3-mannosyltransferase-like protein [Lambiella insularis]|nr:Alpha-1,3-mannosyltransferase-like protein [Lambiella insularis]